jgi:hypothetical protein
MSEIWLTVAEWRKALGNLVGESDPTPTPCFCKNMIRCGLGDGGLQKAIIYLTYQTL